MKRKSKCQHDINISPNSISLLDRNYMTFPPVKTGVCLICGESLTYEYLIKENKYIIREEKEKNHG